MQETVLFNPSESNRPKFKEGGFDHYALLEPRTIIGLKVE